MIKTPQSLHLSDDPKEKQGKVWLKALNELDKKFDEQEVKIRENMEQIRRKIDTLEDEALQRNSK